MIDPVEERDRIGDGQLSLRWSGRVSLTPRILAVNIFALAMLAGGFFYLDSYRSRIVDSRIAQASSEARLVAEALRSVAPERRDALMLRLGADTNARLRLFDPAGRLIADTRALGLRNVVLRDPDKQDWGQRAARFLDAVIDTVVRAERAPLYRERPTGLAWPDVRVVRSSATVSATVWRAPDRTPVITAAAPVAGQGTVMTTSNATDITQTVRVERFRLSMVLLIVSIVSILLSLFLARTIVRPLRRLARAAVRVRLGRAREVVVPRLPSRRDEVGMLARALSDMSLALRARIDATEAFAADVTHEMKNPLASLRSAVESLSMVRDPELQERLLAIVRDDVHRLDRLITDISEASRLDALLSRAKFEAVDLGAVITGLLAQREERGIERGIRLHFDRPVGTAMTVMGEGARLERVFENLIENAVSFSPDGGLITIAAIQDHDVLTVCVEDEGPGVPDEVREQVFSRFHSLRPANEAFGKHSGLGLAIARTIVEGHQGRIAAESRGGSNAGCTLRGKTAVGGLAMNPDVIASISSETLHVSTVAIGGHAVLIEGRSGSGKSDLALRLIDRGATLVSDDYTILTRREGVLVAQAPANITGKIEVRGIGIVSMPHVDHVPVALLVRLDDAVERMPAGTTPRRIAGVEVPEVALAPHEASTPIKVELALKRLIG